MFKGKHWKDDIIAGFVIFLIALPLSIGISLAAGAPASAGILSAILGGILGTLFTGNHIVINGPAAGLIVVMLGSIQSLSDGDPMLGFKRTLAATAVAGCLQIICGLAKWGRLAFLAPSSVVHGMLSAIGFIILIKQVPVILGVKPAAKSILGMIGEIPHYFATMDVPIAGIGLSCLILLLLWNKFAGKLKSIIPGPLQSVGIGLVCSVFLGLAHAHDIELFQHYYHVGPEFLVKVPERFFDMFIFPTFDIVFSLRSIVAILTIFLVCSLESLLSSYAVDKLDPYHRKSNMDKDLVGKGITNLACGLLGAYPIISEIVRSSANIDNGAKTKWANFFHGLFILIFVAALPGLINKIPLASLAAVLMLVGFNLAHPKHFINVYKHGIDQFLFFCTTLVVTVVEDLLLGIAAGIALKILLHLLRGVSLRDFFSPKISVKKTGDITIIEFGSPVVFLGYLKLQKVLKEHEGKNIKIVQNDHFVDFTIRELIKDSIHDAVDLAHAKKALMKTVVVLIYIVLFQPIICFADIDYNFYGIVKATALYSNRPLSSFAYLNSSAPTSAGETTGVVGVNSNEDIWTMQVAQSRVGVDLIQEDIFGNLEFDFINFAQSSPTTESRPRLRRAFVGIAINNNNKLQIGQDWDTFSVQKPVTLDYVGLFFNAGNTGFMRQQMKWRYSQENFQSELSLGMPGKNPSSEYNYTEANSLPVVAYAVNYAGFGISALYSSLKKNVQEREDIWGFNLNYGGSLSSVLKIVAEFYYGQNIDDAGLLGLGKYTSNTNIKEVGGYLNLIYHNESYGDWILGYGAASVVNKEDVVNYSYNTTTQKITENGILNNSLTRLYWSFPLSNSLSLAFETSYFNTKRKVASLDKVTEALSFESGFLYKF